MVVAVGVVPIVGRTVVGVVAVGVRTPGIPAVGVVAGWVGGVVVERVVVLGSEACAAVAAGRTDLGWGAPAASAGTADADGTTSCLPPTLNAGGKTVRTAELPVFVGRGISPTFGRRTVPDANAPVVASILVEIVRSLSTVPLNGLPAFPDN